MHQVLPLQAFGQHKSQGYMERLRLRTQAIDAGKAVLLGNLATVDCCMAEVALKVNAVLEVVRRYGETTAAELARERAELEHAILRSINEAERTLVEESPALEEPYTKLLREYNKFKPASLTVFSYQVSALELPNPISSLLSYQNLCDLKCPLRIDRVGRKSAENWSAFVTANKKTKGSLCVMQEGVVCSQQLVSCSIRPVEADLGKLKEGKYEIYVERSGRKASNVYSLQVNELGCAAPRSFESTLIYQTVGNLCEVEEYLLAKRGNWECMYKRLTCEWLNEDYELILTFMNTLLSSESEAVIKDNLIKAGMLFEQYSPIGT